MKVVLWRLWIRIEIVALNVDSDPIGVQVSNENLIFFRKECFFGKSWKVSQIQLAKIFTFGLNYEKWSRSSIRKQFRPFQIFGLLKAQNSETFSLTFLQPRSWSFHWSISGLTLLWCLRGDKLLVLLACHQIGCSNWQSRQELIDSWV